MRLLISAGGTGGGVYPALAVVDALGERADVLWVGGEGGMEADLVSRRGIPFTAVPAAGVHGVGWQSLPGNGLQLIRGVRAARQLIRSFEPDVLFFTGGFVGVPAALAGWRRPSVTFVPDIEPALSQRVIARTANRICVTTDASVGYYRQRKKVQVTGYPSRFAGDRPGKVEARRALGLDQGLPVLLVMGGSKGARSINRALWAGLDSLLPAMQILHLTGQRDWPLVGSVTTELSAKAAERYQPHAYLHEGMGNALAAADLAVARAGASALGEFPLFGLPSVLVPYPHAWRYQRVNANYLADRGAAVVLGDEGLIDALVLTVTRLMASGADRATMAEAAKALARPGAAEAIADNLLAAAGAGRSA